MGEFNGVLKSFELYSYSSLHVPLVTRWLLERVMGVDGIVFLSLDLGKTSVPVQIKRGMISLEGLSYPVEEILGHIEYGDVYLLAGGRYGKVAMFRDGFYYRLYSVSPEDAPTVEISGIKMHRVVDTTPWRDAMSKVSLANVSKGDRVLDICTGLGYTAIHSLSRGGRVISIELSRAVLDLAKYNPWSHDLEDIPIIVGDAYDVIQDLPRNFFNVVIHDPPRPSLAGHLYGKDFYKRVWKVLRPGGRMVHYIGRPGIKRGRDFARGVIRRLREVGFKVRKSFDTQCIYAVKI